jgi:hypothetical protein
MLRPIAENTFAERQFEECLFAEECICGITYLRNYLFAENVFDVFKFSGKTQEQSLVARGG